MKNNEVLLSICIPTNGVIEWVFPVLDSIYSQNVNSSLFEVVVTDNGDNKEFNEKITEYAKNYKNLKYFKTDAKLFLNEIESYKRASGKFIKFINHRTKLNDGALERFVNFVKENQDKKPIVYFSNGELKNNKIKHFENFDQFVKNLSFFSSWSTGMAFWKEHFDAMPSHENFNELFPHTNILFDRKHETEYIIDDTVLLYEMPTGQKPKGTYDLFHAFAVEYVSIILDLYRGGYITYETFDYLKKQNMLFIRQLYFTHITLKQYSAYDLTGFDKAIKVFYSKRQIKRRIPFMLIKRFLKKLIGKK